MFPFISVTLLRSKFLISSTSVSSEKKCALYLGSRIVVMGKVSVVYNSENLESMPLVIASFIVPTPYNFCISADKRYHFNVVMVEITSEIVKSVLLTTLVISSNGFMDAVIYYRL